jgi:hypothetical protein
VDDEIVELLAPFEGLTELDLSHTAVTDAGLATLAKLPQLEVLRLRATKITDEGFRTHLAGIKTLKRLDLGETSVTPEAVEAWKAENEERRAMLSPPAGP